VRLGQKHDSSHAVARAEAVEVAVQYARAVLFAFIEIPPIDRGLSGPVPVLGPLGGYSRESVI
jgi:hypothetical protein